MRLIGKKTLEKLKHKNKGNSNLVEAVEALIKDIENNAWKSPAEMKVSRSDADCVHNDGFYFFNIAVHRTMVMIEFEESEATIVWAGTHQEYETTFKNNKNTIRKWLKAHEWIEK